MTPILVLAMFAIFAILDYFIHHRRKQPAKTKTEVPDEIPEALAKALRAVSIDGVAIPEELRFHPGHTWAYEERQHLHRVGIDELAARMAGPIEKIELPQPGRWVRQGQKAWAFYANGQKYEMVSPAEGEVMAVNPEVVKDPSLIHQDPYGRGWLMTVSVPDDENVGRNLLPPALVSAWMRDSIHKLQSHPPAQGEGSMPTAEVVHELLLT